MLGTLPAGEIAVVVTRMRGDDGEAADGPVDAVDGAVASETRTSPEELLADEPDRDPSQP